MRACFLLSLALFCTAACEHADPLDPDELQPTLSSIQANIFNQTCAVSGCHAGSSPQQGMNLSTGQAHANIVNVRSNERPNLFRVAPGDPEASYLLMKVEGDPDIVGSRMPLGRPPLSAEEISVIREWIADGAPDN